MVLLAVPSGEDVVTGVIISGLTVFLTLIFRDGVPAFGKLLNERSASSREDNKDRFNELKELIDRMSVERIDDRKRYDAEIVQLQRKLEERSEDHAECLRNNVLAIDRIEYLQEIMENAGLKFRPWKRPGGTDQSTPLPPGRKEGEGAS